MSVAPPALKSRKRIKLLPPRLSNQAEQVQRRYESGLMERVPFPELIPSEPRLITDEDDDDF
jgi:hypothetical protein